MSFINVIDLHVHVANNQNLLNVHVCISLLVVESSTRFGHITSIISKNLHVKRTTFSWSTENKI